MLYENEQPQWREAGGIREPDNCWRRIGNIMPVACEGEVVAPRVMRRS